VPYLTTHSFRYRIVIWNIILTCLGVYGEVEVVALHWGDNSCEFVFATDGQFDNLNT